MAQKMKKSLTILMVVGVSLSSAQDLQYSEMRPRANDRADSVSVGVKSGAPDKGLMYVARSEARGTESVFVKFSGKGNLGRSDSRSFVTSLREEMRSLVDRLPDLSIAWLGVSCYVRNPLRYKLAPGSTYAHQMGFSAGDWNLSVDGIKPNTLEDLHIALQCPVGERISLFVRYTDMQYKVDVYAIGRLPWE